MSTPNTRFDAALRIVEDTVLVAGAAVGAWLTSHNVNDVMTAVVAVPVVRSGVAATLTKGRVSGLALAVKLAWQALNAQTATAEPVNVDPSLGDPVFAPDAPEAADPALPVA
jgi:DNA-binding transcriptional regulator YdaS (Cro superfamily)